LVRFAPIDLGSLLRNGRGENDFVPPAKALEDGGQVHNWLQEWRGRAFTS
jgi:hypothetical protein